MDNKKLIQLLISVIAGIWVFCIVFAVSYKSAIAKKPQVEATTAPTLFIPQGTAVPTTQPSTSFSVPTVTIDGNNITGAAEVGKPQWLIDEEESKKAAEESKKASEEAKKETTTTKPYCPEGKQEIIDAYISAVNKLKNTENFKVVQTNSMSTEFDEITGGDAIKSIAEKLVAENNPSGTVSYNFVRGMDETSGYSPNYVIPPQDKRASLSPEYVTSATAQPLQNGAYKVRIELGRQVQTLTTPAPGYSTVMDTLDMGSLGLTSSMTITSLEIVYDGSYIEAEIDKNGNLLSLTQYTKTQGSGEGKMTFIPASMKMHGDYLGQFVISY